jgi:hypothetical protein
MVFVIENPEYKEDLEEQIRLFREAADVRADGALQG